MKFPETFVESEVNNTSDSILLHDVIRLNPGACVYKTKLLGPAFLDRNSRMGPDVKIGRYCSIGETSIIARGNFGSFIAMGARVSVNPFNHPTNWLSIHDFQYRTDSYEWVPEYRDLDRLSRTADMFSPVMFGNDIWVGNNAVVVGGVSVGNGAVIAAGSVVTKDVSSYAVVAGVPAVMKRLRFDEKTIDRLLKAKWWDLELSDLSGLPFRDVEKCLDAVERIKAAKGRS